MRGGWLGRGAPVQSTGDDAALRLSDRRVRDHRKGDREESGCNADQRYDSANDLLEILDDVDGGGAFANKTGHFRGFFRLKFNDAALRDGFVFNA